MTPPPEPRTAAGKALLYRKNRRKPTSDDGIAAYRADLAAILAIEAEAAGAPLREALTDLLSFLGPLDHMAQGGLPMVQATSIMWRDQISPLISKARAALAARQPAPEPFYDSDGIPLPDELFAGLELAPAPLDVERIAAALHSGGEHAEGPAFDCTMQDGTRYCDRKAAWIAEADAELTARAAATEDTDAQRR